MRIVRTIALVGLIAIVAAPGRSLAADDPLEPFNRMMFGFNKAVIEWVMNPIADHVGPLVPERAITGLGNVYSNLTEIEFFLNGVLVGDPKAALVSAGRFAMNSTLGLGGLFDFAGRLGLERTERDFIESLCRTGLPPGPYVVLPLAGPANLITAGTLAGAVALEVYALSFISMTLAMADFIIIDLGGTASALRYMRDLPVGAHEDPYVVQRKDHLDYVARGCGTKPPERMLAGTP